jgi:hypothetical protein
MRKILAPEIGALNHHVCTSKSPQAHHKKPLKNAAENANTPKKSHFTAKKIIAAK